MFTDICCYLFTAVLEKEIMTGLRGNQFSPGRICWFSKSFDGINPLDDAASEFLETEETQKLNMVELNDNLKNFREVCNDSEVVTSYSIMN